MENNKNDSTKSQIPVFKPQVTTKTETRMTLNIVQVEHSEESEDGQHAYLIKQYQRKPKLYLTLTEACVALARGVFYSFSGGEILDNEKLQLQKKISVAKQANCWRKLKRDYAVPENQGDMSEEHYHMHEMIDRMEIEED